jgi:phosphoglucomutase/phosphomannomutase
MKISGVRDYENQLRYLRNGHTQPLDGPRGDLVMLDFAAEGNYVAARPSGTEPKVKFYMFSYTPAEQLASLQRSKEETAERMSAWERDLRKLIQNISRD